MHTRSPGLRHILLPALIALALPAGAQDWTRFRGPNGSGLGKANLPEQITGKDINGCVRQVQQIGRVRRQEAGMFG